MSLVLHGTNGITFPDSNVQARAANITDVWLITDTSDTALATQAGGGSQIFSTISSATIPTSGQIRLTILTLEYDETEGNTAGTGVAIKIGTDGLVWATTDSTSGALNYMGWRCDASTSSGIHDSGWFAAADQGYSPAIFTWDIGEMGSSTGTQDIAIYMGDNVNSLTGELTVTGTSLTARALVEIIDGSN